MISFTGSKKYHSQSFFQMHCDCRRNIKILAFKSFSTSLERTTWRCCSSFAFVNCRMKERFTKANVICFPLALSRCYLKQRWGLTIVNSDQVSPAKRTFMLICVLSIFVLYQRPHNCVKHVYYIPFNVAMTSLLSLLICNFTRGHICNLNDIFVVKKKIQ